MINFFFFQTCKSFLHLLYLPCSANPSSPHLCTLHEGKCEYRIACLSVVSNCSSLNDDCIHSVINWRFNTRHLLSAAQASFYYSQHFSGNAKGTNQRAQSIRLKTAINFVSHLIPIFYPHLFSTVDMFSMICIHIWPTSVSSDLPLIFTGPRSSEHSL